MARKRSTYCHNVALMFKNIFDDAIHERKDKLIEVPPGKSADGFRQKCSDALLFLMRELDTDHLDYKGRQHQPGDYAKLRGSIKIKYTPNNSIHLAFIVNSIHLNVKSLEPEAFISWKQQIQEYLNNDLMEGKPLILKALFLSAEEQNYAKALFNRYHELTNKRVVVDIGPTEIYAMKMEK